MDLCVRNHILTDGNPYHIDNCTQILEIRNLPSNDKTVHIWVEELIFSQEYQIGMISGIQLITCLLFGFFQV